MNLLLLEAILSISDRHFPHIFDRLSENFSEVVGDESFSGEKG